MLLRVHRQMHSAVICADVTTVRTFFSNNVCTNDDKAVSTVDLRIGSKIQQNSKLKPTYVDIRNASAIGQIYTGI